MGLYDTIFFEPYRTDWLVFHHWRQTPNRGSKLNVNPGQACVVVRNGKVERVFGPGQATISSENLPFISNLTTKIYNGNNPYHCDFYFVNTTANLTFEWDIDSPIYLRDPVIDIPVTIWASGQLGIRINPDYYKYLVTTLIGSFATKHVVTYAMVKDFFRGVLNTKVKTLVSKYFDEKKISVFDISRHLEEISGDSKEGVTPIFNKYGFDVLEFFYNGIDPSEEDLEDYRNIMNKKKEQEILVDEKYVTRRQFDVMEKAAENEGSNLVGAGLGLGIGFNAASAMGQVSAPKEKVYILCPECNSKVKEGAKYCPECGHSFLRKCKKCGAALEGKTKFCPECGEKTED